MRTERAFVRQRASPVPITEMVILKIIKETDGEKYEKGIY